MTEDTIRRTKVVRYEVRVVTTKHLEVIRDLPEAVYDRRETETVMVTADLNEIPRELHGRLAGHDLTDKRLLLVTRQGFCHKCEAGVLCPHLAFIAEDKIPAVSSVGLIDLDKFPK